MSRALVVPTLRATRVLPILGAMAAGLVVVAMPVAARARLDVDDVATLLRIAAVCVAVGFAYLFDDPARPTTATTPVRAWTVIAVRTVAGLLAAALWWVAAVGIGLGARGGITVARLCVRDLTVEAAAILALGLLFGGVAWSLAPRGVGSTGALAGVLAVAGALFMAPDRVALFVPIESAQWHAAHARWVVILVAAAVAAVATVTVPRFPGTRALR